MGGSFLFVLTAVFVVLSIGGLVMAFAGPTGETSKKRLAAAVGQSIQGPTGRSSPDETQRRKNVQSVLKEFEKQQASRKQRPTLRRQIEQAGLTLSVRNFWMLSATAAAIAACLCLLIRQPIFVALLAAFGIGIGLPRWILWFLKARRQKKFTAEFANGIDVIVRSVKSGLPTNEALKIVAKEIPEPVASEFHKLVESMKVGVTLEQALKRMYESMPTAEVSFFAIVMTIQQKSGGNLSEALNNLAGVLRDRKRLQGKIKAMSSEAKASAAIIGSLPPAVMGVMFLTSPDYVKLLFTERLGNLMLAGCALWMSLGIGVMKKMISFRH